MKLENFVTGVFSSEAIMLRLQHSEHRNRNNNIERWMEPSCWQRWREKHFHPHTVLFFLPSLYVIYNNISPWIGLSGPQFAFPWAIFIPQPRLSCHLKSALHTLRILNRIIRIYICAGCQRSTGSTHTTNYLTFLSCCHLDCQTSCRKPWAGRVWWSDP